MAASLKVKYKGAKLYSKFGDEPYIAFKIKVPNQNLKLPSHNPNCPNSPKTYIQGYIYTRNNNTLQTEAIETIKSLNIPLFPFHL